MILVTGATGLLGNCIVRELLARGDSVRVLCRTNTPRTAIDGLTVEIHDGDLSSDEVVDRAVAGCSAVIHSAALIHIGWQKLEDSRDVNVAGTQRIINACKRHSAKLVHVSTVDTLLGANSIERPVNELDPRPLGYGAGQAAIASDVGKPKVPCSYVVSKFEAEQAVRSASHTGLNATIVHPGFMIGPYDWKPSSGRMMLEIRKAPLLIAPGGGCSVCDARDVASATINAIEHGKSGEGYILAGENLTYQQLWQKMLSASGKPRKIMVGGPLAVAAGKLIDATNRLLGLKEGDVNGAIIEMGNIKHFYDSNRAERELNYSRRPVEQTLSEAWKWLEEYHVKKRI